ncbi:MAG: 50S ribosomal protein L35 [Armatimonadetes bacterium]|nr:50S ribosomal protein L35 [Armatimonadota bacterium]
MPKVKTHQGLRKRIKTTGTGKLRRGKQGGAHLKEAKTLRQRRSLRVSIAVAPADTDRIEKLLPYNKK